MNKNTTGVEATPNCVYDKKSNILELVDFTMKTILWSNFSQCTTSYYNNVIIYKVDNL